jgi:hypothetical protein
MSHIAVIGRGSVGALAVLHLLKMEEVEVTCIYDPHTPITEVGEASTALLIEDLAEVLEEEEVVKLLKTCDSTSRGGAKFVWPSTVPSRDFLIEYVSKGVHFNSSKFSYSLLKTLKGKFPHRLNMLKTKVHKIKDSVINDTMHFDLIIDCSGAPTEKEVYEGGKYTPSPLTTVNSVLLYQEQKEFTEEEGYTGTTFHSNGWMFTVPLRHREAYGYLYNSSITSKDQALKGLIGLVPQVDEGEVRNISWNSYYRNRIYEERVIYLGNRLYFFEPTNATPLHLYSVLLREITIRLEQLIEEQEQAVSHLNATYLSNMEQILDLIALNYSGGMEIPSPFWSLTSKRCKDHLSTSSYFRSWSRDYLTNEKARGFWAHDADLISQYLKGLNISITNIQENYMTDQKNNITFYNGPLPYFVINEPLSPREVQNVSLELEAIKASGGFQEPQDSKSAREGGFVLKQNKSVLLRSIYTDPKYSIILNAMGGTLTDNFSTLPNLSESIRGYNSWFMDQVQIVRSNTLVSYYGDGDAYMPHRDNSVLTAVTFITEGWVEDESAPFQGGDLVFTDYGITVPYKHNTTVIFPGFIRHEVTPVSSSKGRGRFSISQFGGAG